MKIAFAGERGAFAELAAIQYFGDNHKLVPVNEFSDVFNAVKTNKTQQGIIPIENSLTGSIHQNYDLLMQNNLFIVGEIFLRVSQFLIANHGVKINKIKKIYSHPQGFGQCKIFLSKLKNVECIPVSNTAVAVKKIKEELLIDAAAIGSYQAAIDYDMNILANKIEDNKYNITRFIIISKNTKSLSTKKDTNYKTSIVFSLKNMPGSLFKCLSVFALKDIDLLKIESRPLVGRPFEYLFYLDFAGNIRDNISQKAINHLKEITVLYKFLGSYPKGKLVSPEYRKR
jgi:prephenate dehydratase